ncbi:MAG: glycosyltransferase [Planctomycetota bacterium]
MKVLLCHNYYQQPGGEDRSFAAEADLFESRGHEVVRFTLHNDAINRMQHREVAWKTVWNRDVYKRIQAVIRRERPSVMHCINTFPLISPACYYAARREGVAVVQSLRNYRLLCPGATCLRQGRICEDCVSKPFAWPAVRHGCYRHSRAGSAVVATMLTFHRWRRTWSHAVNVYYALTHFSRDRFIAGGLPADKVVVKPNFLSADPGLGTGTGGYALFVGRLSHEKGVDTLLSAWARMASPCPLKIVGDGPLADRVRAAASSDSRITWLGYREPSEVSDLMGHAACLVVSSIWYEGFPRTMLEAFARGTPVIGAKLGSIGEIIAHNQTGFHFNPGDPRDLAAKVQQLMMNRSQRKRMRREARRAFERTYTADVNYTLTRSLYERAIGAATGRRPSAPPGHE